MSFRPRPRFLNLGVGRPRFGPPRSRTNELLFSQLTSMIPTTTTIQSSFTTKSRLSTTSTPLSPGGPRRCSHQYQHQHHHCGPRSRSHNYSNRSWQKQQQQHQQTRHNSTNPNSHQNPNPNSNPNKNTERIDRLLTRLPRFLHPYLSSLRSSPSSFIVAFLILHEITAVIPGLGFFYFFHYYDTDTDTDTDTDDDDTDKPSSSSSYGKRVTDWVMGWMVEHGYSEVMMGKMEGFERWFKRKKYFGFGGNEGEGEGLSAVVVGGEDGTKSEGVSAGGGGGEEEGKEQVLMKKWQSGDEKYRVLVDAALAYAITKALLPLRIIVSVQATPWFAGVLGRVRRVFGGGLRK
ncbi:hypothetical protein B0H65DRAFT_459029 [Neurospora tetraspora]|uniref:Uncharacterized protein n=1 Tax=Neurospora tetraspora TaxID=94610 RepID=A0AAE0JM42_9PEZI|nr:hypothetical protein B0H65DRAFT_459029 [Neurospora tetraspora]